MEERKLNPRAAGKIHLRGCNLHTKVCKCNSSIKNLKFDQIVPFFSVLPKNDTAHFDHMFDLIDGNLFDLKRAKDPSLYQIQIEWGIKSASNYLKILLVGLLEIDIFTNKLGITVCWIQWPWNTERTGNAEKTVLTKTKDSA